MQSNNRDIASVWDMIQAIRYIQSFTDNLSFEAYLNNILIRSAVERQLGILGEAARRISQDLGRLIPRSTGNKLWVYVIF